MRLRRLHLTRYGHFDGRTLDFGERPITTDVTVIFGPNEAGKSTVFSAWLDLLYGFPSQGAPYAFLFERKDSPRWRGCRDRWNHRRTVAHGETRGLAS